ncbi:MAG: hypothetical protein WC716_06755 [Chitinophagaceae bacterium]
MNISILWDLSDRIDPGKQKELPSHSEKDIAILKYFADYFRADMDKKGAYFSKGKLKVFFSPNPTDRNINTLASQLAVDLSAKDIKEKKLVYDNISTTFQQTGQKIAETSIQTSNWQGADIYRFFKNNVVDYCVNKDTSYRNILVVITDGYVYEKSSVRKKGNQSEYILPSLLSSLGLRDNPNYQSVFEAKNCGLITTRNDLDKLEILVLEINSQDNHKNDEDIIKLYLQKWFTDMKVKHFKIYNTDLPENVEKHIADFMN